MTGTTAMTGNTENTLSEDREIQPALDALLLDHETWDQLEDQFSGFNLFEAIGHVRAEERHSDFFAFLLDPQAPHGLGDEFLTRFLQEVLKQLPSDDRPVNLVEMSVADLSPAMVLREHHNIDILAIDETNQLVVVIENKVDTSEHSNQLERYRSYANDTYPEFRRVFVYLTVEGEPPSDANFVAFSYTQIAVLVEEVLRRRGSTINVGAKLALEHYLEMLRRHIVPNEELIKLARDIYKKHKTALEFIFEQRPDQQLEISDYTVTLVRNEASIELVRHAKSYTQFCPADWRNMPKFNATDTSKWTKTGRSLLFEFRNNVNGLQLTLVLGPCEPELRKRIYDFCTSHPEEFPGIAKPMGAQWSTLYSKKMLTKNQLGTQEMDALKDRIGEWWDRFLRDDMLRIRSALEAEFAN